MFKAIILAAMALLVLPGVASAATATAHVRVRGGVTVGPVTFAATRGEVNRLTISTAGGLIVFRDRAQPVTARGDCRRVVRHTARCPFTEDIAQARLGDGADRATLRGGLVEVHGGPGGDVLAGDGTSGLFGDGGDDTLRGGRGGDDLNGGPGRDVVAGRGGDDTFVDGETDRQAAHDVYMGGPATPATMSSGATRAATGSRAETVPTSSSASRSSGPRRPTSSRAAPAVTTRAATAATR